MTIREQMKESGQNLGWCKPYISDDGGCAISVNGGEVSGMLLNGKEVPSACLGSAAVRDFAKAVNPDYELYSGWDDLHIALEGNIRECGCAACPWFDICEAMDADSD